MANDVTANALNDQTQASPSASESSGRLMAENKSW